jgi:hypothetical protein
MKRKKMAQCSRWFRGVLAVMSIGGWFSLAAMPVLAAVDSESCSANPESRQFDFWLGDWNVTYPGVAGNSNSTVSLSLDKCLVTETWVGGKGHTGRNMFAYSADDKSWHGMFADNLGRVHVFEGKIGSGSAEFFGPGVGADGKTVLHRIRVIRINADRVEQSWEKSTDHGATWKMEFRGEYSRKKT